MINNLIIKTKQRSNSAFSLANLTLLMVYNYFLFSDHNQECLTKHEREMEIAFAAQR